MKCVTHNREGDVLCRSHSSLESSRDKDSVITPIYSQGGKVKPEFRLAFMMHAGKSLQGLAIAFLFWHAQRREWLKTKNFQTLFKLVCLDHSLHTSSKQDGK